MAVYSSDGKKIASASVDSSVQIWDARTFETIHTLSLRGTGLVMSVAFTPDCMHLVSIADTIGSNWDMETGYRTATMRGHTSAIWSVALSHAGRHVITGSQDQTARVWDIQTGTEIITIDKHTGPIWAVAFSPDDKEVLTGSYDGTLAIHDSSSGECLKIFDTCSGVKAVCSAAYSHSGKYIISGAADGTVRLWDRFAGSLIAELHGHTNRVQNVMFNSGDTTAIASGDDGLTCLWSIQDIMKLVAAEALVSWRFGLYQRYGTRSELNGHV